MIRNKFIEEISDMSNYTYIPELPEFSRAAERKARQIIGDIDRKYRSNIDAKVKEDSTVIHVRENDYNGRKVVQFQVRTARL